MDERIRYLAPKEVAEALGLGLTKVYDLVRTGQIPHRRFGKRIVVPRQWVEWHEFQGSSAQENGAGGGPKAGNMTDESEP